MLILGHPLWNSSKSQKPPNWMDRGSLTGHLKKTGSMFSMAKSWHFQLVALPGILLRKGFAHPLGAGISP
jgi:hypothetical protein